MADDLNTGGPGTQINNQYFRFACKRCGIAQNSAGGPIVANSGFKITETVSKNTANVWVYEVTKEGFGNNGAAAGTSINQNAHSQLIEN